QRRTLGNVRDGHQWSARRRSPLQPGPFLHTSLYGLLHHRRRRDSHDVPLLGGVQEPRDDHARTPWPPCSGRNPRVLRRHQWLLYLASVVPGYDAGASGSDRPGSMRRPWSDAHLPCQRL
ncbi:hypothetical protein AAVH_34251, partial [Aphelenchoides avenae]